jgi:hypothetical protein
VDSWVASTDGRVSCYFQEPIHMEQWIGLLGGILYEEWIESSQSLIALWIDGLHEASCIVTLQDSIVGGRFSASFRLVCDPRIIISFSLVQLVLLWM